MSREENGFESCDGCGIDRTPCKFVSEPARRDVVSTDIHVTYDIAFERDLVGIDRHLHKVDRKVPEFCGNVA